MENTESGNLLATIKAMTAEHARMKKANLKHRSAIRDGDTKAPYPFPKRIVTNNYAKLQRMKTRLMKLQDEEALASKKASGQIDPIRDARDAEARVQSGIFTWAVES